MPRPTQRFLGAALAALILTPAGVAHAQGEPEGDERHQMTMPKGQLLVRALLEINLSKDSAMEPVSLAPDFYYGVSDVLTVGVVHSGYGSGGFLGGFGNGLCLTGDTGGCAKVYDNVGLIGRYQFMDESVTLAADGGLIVRSFDPFQLSLRAGVVGAWRSGKVSVVFNPSLFLGVSERDGAVMAGTGNKEVLAAPVALMYQVSGALQAGLQTGVVIPFTDTGDTWQLPLSLGAQYAVNSRVAVLGAFSLPALAGGELVPTGFDVRSITLGGEFGF
jgi:hypothetical protein